MSNSELACVYAALILADDDVAITVSSIILTIGNFFCKSDCDTIVFKCAFRILVYQYENRVLISLNYLKLNEFSGGRV